MSRTLVQRNRNYPTLRRDPFRFFTNNLLSWDPFETQRLAPTQSEFVPRFEVKETDDSLLVRADLPGVAESDLDITLDGDVLTVKGSRSKETKKEGETYYLYERAYGSFERSFRLPDHANEAEIAATLTNGVLELAIPKRPEAKAKKIAIKS